MTTFRYQGRTSAGKIKRGRVTGQSRREVTILLKEKGIAVTELDEIKETIWNKDIQIERGVKQEDFTLFLRQFSTLLSAGVTLVDATELLAEQTDSKPLKTALDVINSEIRAGSPFSQAASTHHKIFPPLFIHMLRAGEMSGNMEEALIRLAGYFEKQNITKQKVKAAMTYPIMVSIVAIGVVFFMLTFVLPRFQTMFASFHAELPLITRSVLGASHWLAHYWWLFLIIVCLLVFAFYYFYRRPKSRYYIDQTLLKVPVFGPFLQKVALARYARTMSSLLASSVPILQALDMAGNVVGNKVIEKVIKNTRDAVSAGGSLAGPMKTSDAIPPMVTQMVLVGETTGALDAMLAKVADFYEAEVELMTDRLKALVEPLMIVVLSVIVGVIVLSVMLPMFQLYNDLS